ncbi:aminotransferase class I/II-fold pyridoxal phosphate-dependent enzyme [Kitasatospora purpeofusca]|uniref:aminotransferase class I/II-fold pyridoxal phosphate-dependent enzyme n=1 Tax=Kitasatospora purpeofusca TaxID=67352 RepID=UPI0036628169
MTVPTGPTGLTGPTGPIEPAELLARIPDFEQALAYYRRHLAPATAIDLSVAENVLVYEDSMQKMVFDHTALLPETYIHYMSAYGGPDLRNEVAALLSKAFEVRVEAGDVFGTGGVGSALECLAFALQDPPKPGESGPPPLVEGDAVLLPAPYWQGFNWSFEQRPKLKCVPVKLSTEGPERFRLTLDAIKEEYFTYHRLFDAFPRLLVLTNPHNPLGVNYGKRLLEEIYAWVIDETDMHIVSDEIYCHSQVDGVRVPFTNAFALDAYRRAPERIHVVWGFAKDFGLSGFRTGFVVSKYGPVQRAMLGTAGIEEKKHPMSWFTPVDSLKQYVLGALLETTVNGTGSELYTDYAMRRYRELLSASFERVKDRLVARGIEFVHTEGDNPAQFFWLDLTAYLGKVPPNGPHGVTPLPFTENSGVNSEELKLFNYLASSPTEVTLLPGETMHSPAPGYFRLCFTAYQPEVVCEAIDRVADALAALGSAE